ncbi:unnamed protein product [Schistosoma turkestanicum]|nr:unnamed protein product [Schistosoma turkestanicum]
MKIKNLKFQCSKNTGLQVLLNNRHFDCPVEGGFLNVILRVEEFDVSTTINCPPCQSLCKNDCPKKRITSR